ncbi:hypothetical protein EV189_2256 [Motilibacter rhizosphaerae]|uniref:Uncharacterized protein n=1 Tax=Motilibacter rhizosphaerae TaxID=598652 RepID=A0A4Q7NQH9_9ACTN|nr:hypothetical protein [Motilibacter rhizosphaerae]RZS86840.1 hypothetical protein EV189_2256 [Motilibacter rhizosphaerae]
MQELLNPVLGVLLAVLVERLPSSRARALGWLIGSLVCGAAVTVLTGEYAVSPELVLVDVPLTALSAALARSAVLGLAGRRTWRVVLPYRRSWG